MSRLRTRFFTRAERSSSRHLELVPARDRVPPGLARLNGALHRELRYRNFESTSCIKIRLQTPRSRDNLCCSPLRLINRETSRARGTASQCWTLIYPGRARRGYTASITFLTRSQIVKWKRGYLTHGDNKQYKYFSSKIKYDRNLNIYLNVISMPYRRLYLFFFIYLYVWKKKF